MIDLNFLRNYTNSVILNLKKRNINFDVNKFFLLDSKIKFLKNEIYFLNREHNLISFFYKKSLINNNFSCFFLTKIYFLKKKILDKKENLNQLCNEFTIFLLNIPNSLHFSVPYGLDSSDNLEVRVFMNIKNINKNFNEKLFNDFEKNIKYIDFDLSSKISGTGFLILRSSLSHLYRAIGNYMLDRHINIAGYEEIHSPLIVKDSSMYFSGHFPKFREDQFNLTDTKLWLIPTAEVILVNLVSNSFIDSNLLPLKFISKTSCFRKEKGNYGYLVKGIIRQHQFEKVELINIVEPKISYDSLEELVFNVEKILQELDLPYRVLSLCSGDIGFTSSKTYDLEVWMPKRKIYLEVSSCSNTESFQSRRMNAKIKYKNNKIYPHILNGSGLAIGRILLAIIENYSDEYGNIHIPSILIKYMNGLNCITF